MPEPPVPPTSDLTASASSHPRGALLRHYGLAAGAVAAAALLRWPLQPLLGANNPFTLFYPAIVVAAWLGGLGPGLVATALAAVAADYFYLEPHHSLLIVEPADAIGLALFVAVGAVLSLCIESWKRALLRTRRDGEELRRLLHDQRRDREELQTMSRIGHILAAELEVEPLARALTGEVTAATGARWGAFFYHRGGRLSRGGGEGDPQEGFRLCASTGAPHEAFAGLPLPGDGGLLAPVFRGEGLVRSADVASDPRSAGGPLFAAGREAGGRQTEGRQTEGRQTEGPPMGGLEVHSLLASPIVSRQGPVLGALLLGHPEPGVFGEREERLVGGIAEQAAIALDNARLYRTAGEARELAENASHSKDEFLAIVSHELRTPLNAMLGWAQLLQMTPRDVAKIDRGLETIVRNAKLQAHLIDDLLDVSRIISGRLRLEVRSLDLVRVIESAANAIGPTADAKGVRLHLLLDPRAGQIAGDGERLQQVVWNLLSNAVKFTPRDGRVEVRLERADSHVEILVSDTGAGIGPEFLPYVFERFRQVDTSITRKQGGLGLGLAIVRHLVELHGGSVEVRSPGDGLGSTFIVRLPLAIAHLERTGARLHPTVEIEPQPLDPGLDLQGLRVLVVEDEVESRETLRHVLAHCRAEVLTAGSAAEAFAELPRFRPDVLLCDLGMPGEDGYSLIRRVRELPPERGGRTPAAALTAFARVEDRRQALLAGFQMHLAKPVEVQELAAAVAALARGAAAGPSPIPST